jgi:hypothetical protein
MEYLIFAVGVFVLAVYWIWRVRRGGSYDNPDRAIQGLPDDLREKNIHGGVVDPMYANVRAPRPVSRDSGSGKDGGG